MEFLRKNIAFIFFFAAIICVLAILLIAKLAPGSNLLPKPIIIYSPTPTSRVDIKQTFGEPDPGRSYQVITPENEQQRKQSSLVANLIDKLPYQRENFKLDYILNINRFMLILNDQEKALGEKEFNEFLKQNGIDDKSWLYNLTTTYETL